MCTLITRDNYVIIRAVEEQRFTMIIEYTQYLAELCSVCDTVIVYFIYTITDILGIYRLLCLTISLGAKLLFFIYQNIEIQICRNKIKAA